MWHEQLLFLLGVSGQQVKLFEQGNYTTLDVFAGVFPSLTFKVDCTQQSLETGRAIKKLFPIVQARDNELLEGWQQFGKRKMRMICWREMAQSCQLIDVDSEGGEGGVVC